MAKQRLIIESNFPAVKKAAYETIAEAREIWIREAKDTAQSKLESGAGTHGYALSAGVEGEKLGFQSAKIFTVAHSSKWGDNPWWLKFFEYGTVTITAIPFMRPAARKANKEFVLRMGNDLEGKIRRRAGVRRR